MHSVALLHIQRSSDSFPKSVKKFGLSSPLAQINSCSDTATRRSLMKQCISCWDTQCISPATTPSIWQLVGNYCRSLGNTLNSKCHINGDLYIHTLSQHIHTTTSGFTQTTKKLARVSYLCQEQETGASGMTSPLQTTSCSQLKCGGQNHILQFNGHLKIIVVFTGNCMWMLTAWLGWAQDAIELLHQHQGGCTVQYRWTPVLACINTHCIQMTGVEN